MYVIQLQWKGESTSKVTLNTCELRQWKEELAKTRIYMWWEKKQI